MAETANLKTLAHELVETGVVRSHDVGVAIIRSVFGVIATALSEGKSVKVRRFGTFTPRVRGARVQPLLGADGLPGETMEVPETTIITFRTSGRLKQYVKVGGDIANPMTLEYDSDESEDDE